MERARAGVSGKAPSLHFCISIWKPEESRNTEFEPGLPCPEEGTTVKAGGERIFYLPIYSLIFIPLNDFSTWHVGICSLALDLPPCESLPGVYWLRGR